MCGVDLIVYYMLQSVDVWSEFNSFITCYRVWMCGVDLIVFISCYRVWMCGVVLIVYYMLESVDVWSGFHRLLHVTESGCVEGI